MKTIASAVVRLSFQSEKQLVAVLNALKPEAEAPITRRSRVDLTRQGLLVMINFESEDVVALRAAMNSYLRWIDSTINVVRAIEHI